MDIMVTVSNYCNVYLKDTEKRSWNFSSQEKAICDSVMMNVKLTVVIILQYIRITSLCYTLKTCTVYMSIIFQFKPPNLNILIYI